MKNEFNNLCQEVTEALYKHDTFREFTFEDDDLDGKDFGQDGKFYHIKLTGTLRIMDLSDYNKEYGYGKKIQPEIEVISDFTILEYTDQQRPLRNELQIHKENPELYQDLLKYARIATVEEQS